MNTNNATTVRSASGDRRQDSRRSAADRRRNAEQPIVAIEVGESTLQIAISLQRGTGQRLVSTIETQWRREASTLQSKLGETELLAALQSVVAEHRLSGSVLRVALGGSLCVTRALVGASDEVNRELQDVRDRSRMYLTLGSGKKAVATSIASLDARHKHALLAVASQTTLDVIARVADACGLIVQSIESSQAAICQLLSQDQHLAGDTVLVLHFDNNHLHIAAVRDGRLLIDYRPGGKIGTEDVGELLTQHYSRLSRYCQRHFGADVGEITRVVVVGKQGLADELNRNKRQSLPLRVSDVDLSHIDFPWKWTGPVPAATAAAPIGELLGTVEGASNKFPNLADCISDVSRAPVLPALLKLASPLAACLLITLGATFANWQIQQNINSLQAELDLISPVVLRSERLRGTLVSGRQEVEQLAQLANMLPSEKWGILVDSIANCMPDDTWLQILTVSDLRAVSLEGASYSESGIYDFVGHLQHMPTTADVALLGTSTMMNRGAPVSSFDIDLQLQDAQIVSIASNEGVPE